MWTADSRDKEGIPTRDVGSVRYNVAIESAAQADTDENLSAFGCRVEREARRSGFVHAKRQVIIGDGARWIWSLADELFPEATQIVDLFHAKGTLSEVARKIFGADCVIGQEKAKKWRDLLEQGKVNQILGELGIFAESCHEAYAKELCALQI